MTERAREFLGHRPARQAFHDGAAEIQRRDVSHREPLLDGAEGRGVDAPPLRFVVGPLVVDGEAGLLQRLEVASDGAGRDAYERGQFVDRDPSAPGLDLTEHLPLPDDLGVSHGNQAGRPGAACAR